MIKVEYLGKSIKSIPVEEFENCRFDDPSNGDERYPGLALVSVDIVPKNAHDWFLQCTAHMGYSIMPKYAAIKPLSIKSSIEPLLRRIVEEEFEESNLGYGTTEAEYTNYTNMIEKHGLTYTRSKSGELRQALYPLDATQSNLSILTHDDIDLFNYEDVNLLIYVVGENCD